MSKVKITETVLRDSHQSLIATRMTTEEMLPILSAMDEVGYHSLEAWGGATFDSCMRFLNEDPWERLRKIRNTVKRTKLQMLFRGQNILGYRHYADDVVEYFVQKSIANGIDILRIFDENIREISMKDEHNFRLKFEGDQPKDQVMSDKELLYFLSSGTTKGMLLYTFVVASLKYGFDLIIDEVEDHFHKTLVENMLSLYKDKSVNRHNATLIFTTHYCEVLDLFNRQDNIWISKANGKVSLSNMYDDYDLRPELLKSKQFYNNAFQTSVNYEDLMKLKKELMRA